MNLLDPLQTPTHEEVRLFIQPPGRERWERLNLHLQEHYRAKAKLSFSKCSAQPGWNVKYQKSGKALCTLYPEQHRFIALVVVTLGLLSVIRNEALPPELTEIIERAKPLNGTLWLMIPVESDRMLEGVQELLALKHERSLADS
ncbi:MAG: DUF3788 domain-containing protein [Bacteroidota bacterium]